MYQFRGRILFIIFLDSTHPLDSHRLGNGYLTLGSVSILKEKNSSGFLLYLFFKIGFLCSLNCTGIHSVDQARLKLTEIHLFLPLDAGIKGVCHYYPTSNGFRFASGLQEKVIFQNTNNIPLQTQGWDWSNAVWSTLQTKRSQTRPTKPSKQNTSLCKLLGSGLQVYQVFLNEHYYKTQLLELQFRQWQLHQA